MSVKVWPMTAPYQLPPPNEKLALGAQEARCDDPWQDSHPDGFKEF